MGLDIYLYHVTKPQAEIDADNDKWQAETSRIYNEMKRKISAAGREDFTNDDRAEWKRIEAESAATFGRVARKVGEAYTTYDHPNERRVEINSSLHPENIFKIGYFRSSYNDGGIDRKLRAFAGTSLGEIMGNSGDEYCFTPDWKASRERASAVLEKFRKLDSETTHQAFPIDIFSFSGKPEGAKDEAEAIAIAKKTIDPEAERRSPFGNFSNSNGLFLLANPAKCVAFIAGTNCLGRPMVYGITEAKAGDVLGWYIQALEIVVETCDHVLSSGEPEKHCLHWSG